MRKPHISVVVPVYGCVGCLEELAQQIAVAMRSVDQDHELIFVDDASPDGAWSRIHELASLHPEIRGVRLSRNFGQHPAITAGLSASRGEWVVVMDCDLQDPPAAIPDLYRRARHDGLDVVFAQRQNRKDSIPKRLSSWGFFKILSWLTGIPQDSSTANFGIFQRKVIDAVLQMPERDKCFPLMVKWVGFKTATMPVEHARRQEGKSSYSLRRLLRLALEISLSYSEKPLRVVAVSGMIAALLSFFLTGFAVTQWLAGDVAVAGFTSIIASLWLVAGLILFSLGIVGLYVGQVFRNAQRRPSFIISEFAER
ncbi:glycosyltransferase family 2 protein [Pseudoxanthomonas sp. 10H]|uniref:glycosyltransferase family 2 protein n=1 Tax=Pseudoxanthomonas sp. 10H TaxID=3242729 RepID=UPI003557D09F